MRQSRFIVAEGCIAEPELPASSISGTDTAKETILYARGGPGARA